LGVISSKLGIVNFDITCNIHNFLILVNGMEHMVDLPLTLDHA
jgi:hypothetical protein